MRFRVYLGKTWKENLRDWKILIFTLLFAPCFVFAIYGAFGHSNTGYNIFLINKDLPGNMAHSQAIIELLQTAKYPDGVNKYKLFVSTDQELALKKLKNRSADALVILPEDLSATLEKAKLAQTYTPSKLKLYGDPRNSRYAIASILLLTDLDLYVRQTTKTTTPLELDETLLGKGKALTDFDLYVPGLIVMALLNVMFTAGASFLKESEKGTLQRLKMSKLRTGEFIGAISVIQITFALFSLLLAFGAALLCGFQFQGSYLAVVLLGLVSGLGIIGFSLVTVSFLKSVYDLMTVGVIPYFIVMFFAGMFFPLPPIEIANFGEHVVKLNDLLPLSLSVTAFNKVLNFGAGIKDLGFELTGILLVALVYFLLGLWLYQRKHMKTS